MVEVHQDSYSTAKALFHSAGEQLILMQQKILVCLGNLFLEDLTNPISKIKIDPLASFRIIHNNNNNKSRKQTTTPPLFFPNEVPKLLTQRS